MVTNGGTVLKVEYFSGRKMMILRCSMKCSLEKEILFCFSLLMTWKIHSVIFFAHFLSKITRCSLVSSFGVIFIHTFLTFIFGYYFTATRLRHFSEVNVGISIPGRRVNSDLLNIDGDKNDYDWWATFLMFNFHLFNCVLSLNYIFLILTVLYITRIIIHVVGQ